MNGKQGRSDENYEVVKVDHPFKIDIYDMKHNLDLLTALVMNNPIQ